MYLLTKLFQDPWMFLVIMAAFLAALTFHEAAHAAVAYWQGDATAKRLGRLSLNPLVHIDVWGFLALLIMGFGWGKPVPFNPYNLRNQRLGPVLVAAAGPASNLILGAVLAMLGGLLLPSLGQNNLLIIFLAITAFLNFVLCLFNLIPIPPLDGSKALLAILSGPQNARLRLFLETQGPILLIMLIVLDSFLGLGFFSFLNRGAFYLLTVLGGQYLPNALIVLFT